MWGTIVALVLAFFPPASLAAESAKDALERGAYADAQAIGERSGDPAGLVTAADAFLMEGRFALAGKARNSAFQKAEALARRAIAVDPRYEPAHIALAVALGCQARDSDVLALYFRGIAAQGRREIDRALNLAPDDPYALALLGEWHLEIVRRAGAGLAASLYHATLSEGTRAFEAALALSPDNAVIHAEFGLALLALKEQGLRARARYELDAALLQEPKTMLEKLTLTVARDMRDHLS